MLLAGSGPGWAPPNVYREGWDAVFAGRQRTENPYERGGTWHAAWLVGYDDARRERDKDEDGMEIGARWAR